MEDLFEFLLKNSGDHYLNRIGNGIVLSGVLGCALVYVTRFFTFKSGFKLSNIRKIGWNFSPVKKEELNVFGKICDYLFWLFILLVILGAVMMVIPF